MAEQYYLVRADILSEAMIKTVKAKQLLTTGEVKTVHEAVARVELSRSAFYKYKDGIFLLNQLERERIVTISMDLEHRSGVLSKVLGEMATFEGNVLTINQTIPLQGMANVVISVETSLIAAPFGNMLDSLQRIPGVRRVEVVGQG